MKGLHVCKPGNEPQVGQVKTFIISGNRIKSKKAEDGGQSYTITKVEQWQEYKDSYNNLGFNIEVEPTEGSTPSQAPHQQAVAPRQGDDRSNRIERQHSQEMALRYMYLKFPTGIPENVDGTSVIRDLTSWFQRDISRSPDEKPEPDRGPHASEDDTDIPF